MSNSRRLEVQGVAVLSMYVVSDNDYFHLDNQNEGNRYSYGAIFLISRGGERTHKGNRDSAGETE